jgi:hypothetical protein
MDADDVRRDAFKAMLRKRLQRVRGRLTDDQFERLLADVARTAERFTAIENAPGANKPVRARQL